MKAKGVYDLLVLSRMSRARGEPWVSYIYEAALLCPSKSFQKKFEATQKDNAEKVARELTKHTIKDASLKKMVENYLDNMHATLSAPVVEEALWDWLDKDADKQTFG